MTETSHTTGLTDALEWAAWFIQTNCEGGVADRAVQYIDAALKNNTTDGDTYEL